MGVDGQHGLVVTHISPSAGDAAAAVAPADTARRARSARIAVFGAGPAGLMAAERLAEAGARVTVYERMPSPARKLLMAGRGGLNLTHAEPLEHVLTRYGEADARLVAAVAEFTPERLVAWADHLGAETFVGSSGRIFPRAMKASPLLRAWLARLDGLGVTLSTRHRLAGLTPVSGAAAPVAEVETPNGTSQVTADAVVLALGGASWPRLGADGGWVGWLSRLGIAVTPLCAANAGIRTDWSAHVSAHAGSPLKRVVVRFGAAAVAGELVITRDGLEGGPIYALLPGLRRHLAQAQATGALPAVLHVDLRPDVDHAVLHRRLDAAGNRTKPSVATRLRKAAALSPAAIALLREGLEAGRLPADAADLATRIKAAPVRVRGIGGLDRAISTAGGLAFASLDERFMVRELPGVFAAGEMLDWEAPTGGYLLQATFATAVAAAEGVLTWLAENRGRAADPSGVDAVVKDA